MDNKSIAYMNIAMIKYWGKDKFSPYLIPLVSSISLLSKNMFTETRIEENDKDTFILNDQVQDEFETKKIFNFVDKVVKNRGSIKIISRNTMPTAAGLASSASAYGALIKELNRFFKLKLNTDEMAKIASMGSGSAARSFYNICAFTKKGEIYEIKSNMELLMGVVLISSEKKIISSREAMEISKKTSSIIDTWVLENEKLFNTAKKALEENSFHNLGLAMEKSTMLMHETMITSKPSFTYLTDESKKVIEYIKELRKNGNRIYFTTDAGPNVKFLYLKEDEKEILNLMKEKYGEKVLEC